MATGRKRFEDGKSARGRLQRRGNQHRRRRVRPASRRLTRSIHLVQGPFIVLHLDRAKLPLVLAAGHVVKEIQEVVLGRRVASTSRGAQRGAVYKVARPEVSRWVRKK